MDIFTLIGGVILLYLILRLKGRVRKLEKFHSSKTEPSVAADPVEGDISNKLQDTVDEASQDVSSIKVTATGPNTFDRFTTWLKEDWLLKLGALLLLIGFGWLTTYAFLNNWIGPAGRIAIGIVAGSFILVLGWWRIRSFVHQGGIFLALGSTVIILTVFAARELYNFFDPISALGIMFLSTAFIALASVIYKSKSLALVSLILAFVAPLLTGSSDPNYIGLFSYLLVVTMGTVWIVAWTGWRDLTIAALIAIAAYSAPHLSFYTSADKGVLLLFAYVFTAIFFITNTLGVLKLKGKKIIPDLLTAAGNGLFVIVWVMTTAQDEYKSLILAAWMIVFAIGGFAAYKITGRREPFYTYIGVGIAMLATATAAELEGAKLAIAYTIESASISLISYIILKDINIARRLSFLLLGPVVISFGSIGSRAWATSVIHEDFFVLLVLSIAFIMLGLFLWSRNEDELTNKEDAKIEQALLVVGSIYVYLLIWLSLHAAIVSSDLATMISLFIYTISGLTFYFYGRFNNIKPTTIYGAGLLAFVVGRLIIIDVWDMLIPGRIITFFIIGALLMSTAFIGRKKSSQDNEIS